MTDTIDKVAMYLSGGLLLLGVVVTGLMETLAGQPYTPTDEQGNVLSSAVIEPNIRTALVVAGLLVLGTYAVYKLAATDNPVAKAASTTASK